jgi:hypothetical protein
MRLNIVGLIFRHLKLFMQDGNLQARVSQIHPTIFYFIIKNLCSSGLAAPKLYYMASSHPKKEKDYHPSTNPPLQIQFE